MLNAALYRSGITDQRPGAAARNFKKQQLTESVEESTSPAIAPINTSKNAYNDSCRYAGVRDFYPSDNPWIDRDQQTEEHHHKQNQRTHASMTRSNNATSPTLTNVNVTALYRPDKTRRSATTCTAWSAREQNPPFGGPTLWRKRNDQCPIKGSINVVRARFSIFRQCSYRPVNQKTQASAARLKPSQAHGE